MNRRERRWGRMYLLPLLLALTGLALLPLEWVLRLEGFDAFGELKYTMIHNALIVVYPIILLLLYIFRTSPKTARVFSFVSLGLALLHLALVIYGAKHPAASVMAWVPGRSLIAHTQALAEAKTAQNILLISSDLCFLLTDLTAVFTCLVYASVKTRSDARNAEFDRKNAFVARRYAREELQKAKEANYIDEPTRLVELPPEYASKSE